MKKQECLENKQSSFVAEKDVFFIENFFSISYTYTVQLLWEG
jgi:hypothetical protein